MLTDRRYRNKLVLRNEADPTERRENLTKEILKDGTFFPKPLNYADIDQEMFNWADKELELSFEGERVPTITLYSNQRFSEYMQSWEHSDNKKNFLMNFKTLSRENNPKKGTMNGNASNIPGDRYYCIKEEPIIDKNGQKSIIQYKMKQPFCVDLSYKLTIVSNKLELINEFNIMIQNKFKSGYSYIEVNGHFIYIKLEDVADESEYTVDDRRYFAQTAKFTVKAYIIQEDDFVIEEKPIVKYLCFEGDTNGHIDMDEDDESAVEHEGLYYKPLTVYVTFEMCKNGWIKAKIPYNMHVMKTVTDNVRQLTVVSNDEELENPEEFNFIEAQTVKFKIKRINPAKESKVTFYGYDKDVIYDDNIVPETELDDNQKGEEIHFL